MKPMPRLLHCSTKPKRRASWRKMRSVIKQANAASIKDIMRQQFAVAEQIIAAGLDADHRAGSGHSLPGQGRGRRGAQSGPPRGSTHCRWISWSCSSSLEPNDCYAACVSHPNVVRVVRCRAGIRGRSQQPPAPESRHRGGLFAGAGRGLTAQQSDAEFNALLDSYVQSIFEASST